MRFHALAMYNTRATIAFSDAFVAFRREIQRSTTRVFEPVAHLGSSFFLQRRKSSEGISEMTFRAKFHTDDVRRTRGRKKRATLRIKSFISKIEQIFSGFDSSRRKFFGSSARRRRYCGNRNCRVLFLFISRSIRRTVRVQSYKGLVVTFLFGRKLSTTGRDLSIFKKPNA